MKYDTVLSDKKYIQVGTIGANPSSTAYLDSKPWGFNKNNERGGINDQGNVDDGNDRSLEKRMAKKRGR